MHCQWAFGFVINTPLVIDLDGDRKPEVVFDVGGVVHAISGTDCSELWSAGGSGDSDLLVPIAVADLDGDGHAEVVCKRGCAVVVLDGRTGARLAETPAAGPCYPASTGAIANIDGAGVPEIVVGAGVLRYSPGSLITVWHHDSEGGVYDLSLAADLDGDGVMEVLADRKIWDGLTGTVRLDLGRAGFHAVAEFDPASPGPEIFEVDHVAKSVSVRAGLAASAPGATLFGPYSTGPVRTSPFPPFAASPYSGGQPAVGDFDGDGEAEFGVAGQLEYRVFDRECARSPRPDKCLEAGVLWASRTQDVSSGYTTSTAFDFNCDGRVEAVYRDECWLRVYEGSSGKVVFATAMTSITAIEGPVVADADGDGTAELVISANDDSKDLCPAVGAPEPYTGAPFGGARQGVFILRDPMNRWSRTRPIWNQDSYHVTNVNDDGTIPLKEKSSWTNNNSYRANIVLGP